MNYLTVENISKAYGEQLLFKGLSFHINKGQKVAFVAKNGTGKSTLLKIIAGLESPDGDDGLVQMHKDIKVAYLDQDPHFLDSQSIMEVVLDTANPTIQAVRAYEEALLLPNKQAHLQAALERMDQLKAWDYEVKIKQILSQFNIENLDRPIIELSGGQQKRVAMAKVLIDEPDFLIMDEPTNHLDVEMIEWLENYLNRSNLTLFMVTHDRYFLERVCNTILELDRQTLHRYKGNYSYFLAQKQDREQRLAREVSKAQSLMRNELDWIRRQPKARGTKAKARVDAFYDLEKKATQKVAQEKLQLDIKTTRLGGKILELHSVSKGYGDQNLIEKFLYKFKKKDRVGIVGKNGAGKSTLLNLMLQTESPDSGKIVKGETVQFGYYAQEGIQLKDSKKVIEVVRDIAEYMPIEGKGRNITAAMLLERFLFPRNQHYTYVHKLSGGEKRRLYLLTVLMKNPNFLILDEPTNDLDILTLNVLEEFLLEFKGCLVVVSHDRHFMDKLVDHLFVFKGDGQIRDFPGNYSDYRAWKKREEQEQRDESNTKKENSSKPQKVTRPNQQQRRELNKIEKEISRLEHRKVEITTLFNDTSLPADQLTALSEELGEVLKNLEEKEEQWLELSELME